MSISQVKVGETNHDIIAGANTYCLCETAAATVAKVATVEAGTFNLFTGARVVIKFTNANSASNPTLNVAGTGAYPMRRYGSTAISTGTTTTGWIAGAVQAFTFDGSAWIQDYWNNTTYSNASLGNGYGTCSTAAATTAKVVTLSSYALAVGGQVSVKFTNAVPAGATMNINSKGAKAIYYKGKAITDGVICAGEVATFVYDGSYYHLLTVDRNRFFTSLVPYGIAIPENADLNTIEYLKVGNYYCSSNAITKTLVNCPAVTTASDGTKSGTAFMMSVSSPLSQTVDDESGTWKYRYRTMQLYNGPMYTQYCYSNGTAGNWIYGTWYQRVTTPAKATVGSTTKPVYINQNGYPIACSYTLEKSVPSDAKFTDTQSDWNQTDESQPDAIKNKPFGDLPTGGDTLVWDGDTTGLANASGVFFKVSNATPTMEDLANGLVMVFSNGESGEFPADTVVNAADGVVLAGDYCFIISDAGVGVELDGLVFPETGLYLMYADGLYVTSLTIPGYTGFPSVKKIETKYLPEHLNFGKMTVADFAAITGETADGSIFYCTEGSTGHSKLLDTMFGDHGAHIAEIILGGLYDVYNVQLASIPTEADLTNRTGVIVLRSVYPIDNTHYITFTSDQVIFSTDSVSIYPTVETTSSDVLPMIGITQTEIIITNKLLMQEYVGELGIEPGLYEIEAIYFPNYTGFSSFAYNRLNLNCLPQHMHNAESIGEGVVLGNLSCMSADPERYVLRPSFITSTEVEPPSSGFICWTYE